MVVHAIAHFNWPQLAACPPALQPILLVHTVGDLQRHLLAGHLPRGCGLLFNGGSMLTKSPGGSAYGLQSGLLALLGRARDAEVRLGFYVQEPSLDKKAAAILLALADGHPTLFPLGFGAYCVLCVECLHAVTLEICRSFLKHISRKQLGALRRAQLCVLAAAGWDCRASSALPGSPNFHKPAGLFQSVTCNTLISRPYAHFCTPRAPTPTPNPSPFLYMSISGYVYKPKERSSFSK